MLRIPTRLPLELERTVHDVIGCCITVHRELGPGLLESIYARALDLEFHLTGISFERQAEIPIRYKGQLLCRQRLDFVVAGSIVVEIKAVERLAPVHRAQVLSYLRASTLPVGLLVNFNEVVLKDGLRRIVL